MKFYNFLHDRGETLELKAIDKPEIKWKTVKDVFEKGLNHEKYVTGRIHKLMDIALEVKDHSASVMLQWFVTEQVEEEASFRDILDKLSIFEEDKKYLMILDSELGKRTRSAPLEQ
jgi:ferritin